MKFLHENKNLVYLLGFVLDFALGFTLGLSLGIKLGVTLGITLVDGFCVERCGEISS